MPQVEMLCHVLEYLRLNPDLRVLEGHDLLKHSPCELSLIYDRVDWVILNHVLRHFVEISSELVMILPLQYLLPVLPKDLAKDFASDVSIVRVLRVDPDNLRQGHQQVLKLQHPVRVHILTEEVKSTLDTLVTFIILDCVRSLKLECFIVHSNQFAAVPDWVHWNVLLKIEQCKI